MRKLYFKMLGIALGLFAFEANAQTTHYVKTDGAAGAAANSWATASNDLQEVINSAMSGDKIFVAFGTYLPNRPANNTGVVDIANRDNAFVLKDGVSIYGGFAGTESNENQRVAGNETILSGDLLGNDVAETSTNAANYMTLGKGDNAFHVVLAIGINTSTIFDGFTVTKGNASATSSTIITVNSSSVDKRYGGGIYILNSTLNLRISNISATVNRANGDGYGIASGAGFYINGSSPTIENCQITKNFNTNANPKTAGINYGSGMSLVSSTSAAVTSNPSISNTVFSDNYGNYGAAVSLNNGSAKFTNCVFKANRANGRGGAVDIRGASPTFTNCFFSGNSAGIEGGGGAVYNFSGRPTFVNNIFYQNEADATGANKNISAVYGGENGSNYGAVFINNTFYQNENTSTGALASNNSTVQVLAINGSGTAFSDKKTYLYNNIFFNNSASSNTVTPDVYISSLTLIGAFNNNIVQQTDYTSSGSGNLPNVNPAFISTVPGERTFLAPGDGSPAKDTGDDSYNTTLTDINGNARKTGTIDMGAVEYSTVLPVSFINFTAKAVSTGVRLAWKVASETNNKQFIVSRSTDGKNYKLVREVAGVGTSAVTQSYGFVDQSIATGTYFYKLEQQDLNGDINYLSTQVVKVGLSENNVNVYPNPVKNYVTVAVKAGVYNKFSVIALQGSTLLSGNIAHVDDHISLNLSQLGQGTYFIKLSGANGSSISKVVKL